MDTDTEAMGLREQRALAAALVDFWTRTDVPHRAEGVQAEVGKLFAPIWRALQAYRGLALHTLDEQTTAALNALEGQIVFVERQFPGATCPGCGSPPALPHRRVRSVLGGTAPCPYQ